MQLNYSVIWICIKLIKLVELQNYMDNNKILFVFDLMLEFGGVFSMDWYYIVIYVEFFDDGVVRSQFCAEGVG